MRTAALLTLALLWTSARAEEAPPPVNPSTQLPPRVAIKTNHGTIVVELFPEEAPETVANFLGLVEGTKAHRNKEGALVKKPYYDGMIFHRVIKGFMLQGGCPNSNGTGNPGYQFKDEINADALGLDKIKVIQNKQWHPWLMIRNQQALSRTVVAPLCAKLGIRTNEELQKRLPEVQKIVDKMTIKECYENLGYKFDAKLKSRKPMRGTLAMANAGPNTNGSQFFINMEDNVFLTGKHTVFGHVVSGMDIAKKIESVAVGQGAKPVAPVVIESMRRIVAKKGEEEKPAEEKKAESTNPPAEDPPPAPEEPKKPAPEEPKKDG